MFLFGTLVLAAAQIHLFSAVSTVDHTRKRVDHIAFLRSALMLAKFLHQVKLLLRDDRLLRILKNLPFFLRIVNDLMDFVGLHVCLEIDGMTAIFKSFKNVANGVRTPAVQPCVVSAVVTTLRQCVGSRGWNTLFRENTGDLHRTVAVNAELINLADNLGSRLINHPQVFIGIRLLVAVNRRTKVLSCLTFRLEYCTDFL